MTEFPEGEALRLILRHQREGRWNGQAGRSGSEDGTETTPAHVRGADGMLQ